MIKKREINEKEQEKILTEIFEKYENQNFDKVLNTEYILWLESFTVKHPTFVDLDCVHWKESVSEEDKKRVKDLHLLYSSIEMYSGANFIYPKLDGRSEVYFIKYNGIGYEIGSISNLLTSSFFCRKIDIKNEEEFIDFTDIISNKKQSRTDTIKNRLSDFSDLIKELANENIPMEAITDVFNETIKEINNINKEEN